MSLAAASRESSVEDRELLADLFHALNQPLTSLRCCLELILQSPPGRLENRARRNLRLALHQAESIAWLTGRIRDVVEAGNPTGSQEGADLKDCLFETAADLLPMAEAARKRLWLDTGDSCPVNISPNRLREAIFHLIEFGVGCARAGSEIKLVAGQNDQAAVLTLQFAAGRVTKTAASNRQRLPARGLKGRLDLAIAQRIFESSGGRLEVHKQASHWSLEIRLPLAVREPALPLARPFRRPA